MAELAARRQEWESELDQLESFGIVAARDGSTLYGDDAVDDIVAALNKSSSKAAARSARGSSAGSRSD